MKKGILIYALNNEQMDYCKLAAYCAKNAKHHLGLPVTIVTDSKGWFIQSNPDWEEYVDNFISVISEDIEMTINGQPISMFSLPDWEQGKVYYSGDWVIHNGEVFSANGNLLPSGYFDPENWTKQSDNYFIHESKPQFRKLLDGAFAHKRLPFRNDIRVKSFDISPYDETLVIDCDVVINNNDLIHAWENLDKNFLIYRKSYDLSSWRDDLYFKRVSDYSIDFYWATVFWFRKDQDTWLFFELLKHIEQNWNYYRYLFQISEPLYRNDFAFSIAIHIMNGYQQSDWHGVLPGKLYHILDQDVLIKHTDLSMTFLLAKENYWGEYTLMKTDSLTVHVMNKFSLNRAIDGYTYE